MQSTIRLGRAITRGFHVNYALRATHYSAIKIPPVTNEPVKEYAKGSKEREDLLAECEKYTKAGYQPVDIPIIVNGKEYRSGKVVHREMPSDISKRLCTVHDAPPELIQKAIDGAVEAKQKWERMSLDQRTSVFLKAAELLSGKYRNKILAATMMGQGKTMYQAEIDAAAETIDFLRFNALYAQRIYNTSPEHHAKGTWNKLEFRPLEGIVAAISPFNFTAIGSNLCAAPAQMGNTVVWKPSHTAILSNYYMFELFREAGLPDGVIQFLPSQGQVFGENVFSNPNFSALHFTGGTKTFQHLYRTIASNIDKYKTIPRIVAETGGKNFHVMHESAEVENFVHNTIRGAFEYSGQKCSATSRIYVPKSKWEQVKQRLIEETQKLRIGQPNDPKSFSSAVIDKTSFDKISGYLERAKKHSKILVGGIADSSKGYFIEPTIIQANDPHAETMVEEIFGPVLTVYVYDESWEKVLKMVDQTSQYALTGSVFCRDQSALDVANQILRHSSGNFYVNEKSTGAVVGQQPFGGARLSGTNDKAGSELLLWRFTSVRSVKESLVELTNWKYPSIDLE